MIENADALSELEEKENPVLVPDVENMDDYLMAHYKPYILQKLNQRMAEGSIAELIGQKLCAQTITEENSYFHHFDYWRINQTDLWIQIDLRLELSVETDDGPDTDFQWFSLALWFSYFEDEEQCELEDLTMLDDKPDFDNCWRLDKHLVPILRRDEIDHFASEIWERYYPEAAEDGKLRKPRVLAEKMGLRIQTLKLAGQKNTSAILFFHESEVLVHPEQESGVYENPLPVTVRVASNTIVLNEATNPCGDFDLDIYHECIHYEWHYLFYQLQNMRNNDVKQIRMKKILTKKVSSSPLMFMEQQAICGSYGLMMPASFMRETIQKLYQECSNIKRVNGYLNHEGYRFDTIARAIASEYNLRKARVRARMLQLGYHAAQGALNYVDGRYITPFAFSFTEDAASCFTYVISRKMVAELYQKDDHFRRIMQTGQFAYVDGHVVHCHEANLLHYPGGVTLSTWANAHVDQVSLRFSKIYENRTYKYTFGQMNNDQALKNTFRFLNLSSSMSLREAEQMKNAFMEDMPMSFHSALSYIMKGRITVDELIKCVPISRSTLLRLRTEERKDYPLDLIIALCIGMHLPPWLSDVLLDKAGLSVKRYGTYGYYGTILDCFYMDTLEDVQRYLLDNGFSTLKLN